MGKRRELIFLQRYIRGNKRLEECSVSPVIRETHVKIAMRYCFTPTTMALTKKKGGGTNVGKDIEKLEPWDIAGGNLTRSSHYLCKAVWWFLRVKTKYHMMQKFHSWIYTQINWKEIFEQKLDTNIHGSLINNIQEVETTQRSINW